MQILFDYDLLIVLLYLVSCLKYTVLLLFLSESLSLVSSNTRMKENAYL